MKLIKSCVHMITQFQKRTITKIVSTKPNDIWCHHREANQTSSAR